MAVTTVTPSAEYLVKIQSLRWWNLSLSLSLPLDIHVMGDWMWLIWQTGQCLGVEALLERPFTVWSVFEFKCYIRLLQRCCEESQEGDRAEKTRPIIWNKDVFSQGGSTSDIASEGDVFLCSVSVERTSRENLKNHSLLEQTHIQALLHIAITNMVIVQSCY